MNAEEAKALGVEHGTILHPFEPGGEIQEAGLVDYYAVGYNGGLVCAARYVLGIVGENRQLKAKASEKTAGAVAVETPDPERLKLEESLDRQGRYLVDRVNPLRVSWNLPTTTQDEILARTYQKCDREDAAAEKMMPGLLGV